MKKYGVPIPLLWLLMFFTAFPSCSVPPVDRSGFMPPVKIDMDYGMENDPDTKIFILKMEERMNILSEHLEIVGTRGIILLHKKTPSFMDKIKLERSKVQFVNGTNALIDELERLQHFVRIKQQKRTISPSGLAACELLAGAIKKRLTKIIRKYNALLTL